MKKRYKIAVIVVLIIAIVCFGALLLSRESVKEKDDMAKCLTERGVVMYGTNVCPACASQKDLFGESFQYIDFVDCNARRTECLEKRIEYFPTWIINGQYYADVQRLSDLMSYANCTIG